MPVFIFKPTLTTNFCLVLTLQSQSSPMLRVTSSLLKEATFFFPVRCHHTRWPPFSGRKRETVLSLLLRIPTEPRRYINTFYLYSSKTMYWYITHMCYMRTDHYHRALKKNVYSHSFTDTDGGFICVYLQASGGPRRFELTGWLQLHKVGPDDAGVYTCAARNTFGETSASARLRVIHRGLSGTHTHIKPLANNVKGHLPERTDI